MDYFIFSLGVPQRNELGNVIPLTFTVTNFSNVDIDLLKRLLPLEGMKGNIFKVIDPNGEVLRYDGRLFKRGTPQKEEYVTIKSGASISTVIDLTEFYFFEKAGDYTVELNTGIQDFILLDNKENKDVVKDHSNKHKISLETQKFTIEKTDLDHKPTLGMRFRKEEGRLIKLRKEKIVDEDAPKPPNIEGATELQKKMISTAHNKAYQVVGDSITNLQNGKDSNPEYAKWFGVLNKFNLSVVTKVLQSVSGALQKDKITYVVNGANCDPGDFAYTIYQTRTVYLCSGFWTAKPNGYDSQLGTIIHELTHATSDTEDYIYGIESALQLALDEPAKAINSADNFEYFSETID